MAKINRGSSLMHIPPRDIGHRDLRARARSLTSVPMMSQYQRDVAWWNTYPTVVHDSTAASEYKYKMWYNGCGDCGCAAGSKSCSVVAPFAPTTPNNLSNNGMCPHLGYNYSSTAFGAPNIARLPLFSRSTCLDRSRVEGGRFAAYLHCEGGASSGQTVNHIRVVATPH